MARSVGLYLRTWNPGDVTRYRLFNECQWNPDLSFHDGDGIFTAIRLRECYVFLQGYRACMNEMIQRDEAHGGPVPAFLRRQAE